MCVNVYMCVSVYTCVGVAPGSPSTVGCVTHWTPRLLELQLFHKPSYVELLFITDSLLECILHTFEFVLLDSRHHPRMARTRPITSTITSAITPKNFRNWNKQMEIWCYTVGQKNLLENWKVYPFQLMLQQRIFNPNHIISNPKFLNFNPNPLV